MSRVTDISEDSIDHERPACLARVAQSADRSRVHCAHKLAFSGKAALSTRLCSRNAVSPQLEELEDWHSCGLSNHFNQRVYSSVLDGGGAELVVKLRHETDPAHTLQGCTTAMRL